MSVSIHSIPASAVRKYESREFSAVPFHLHEVFINISRTPPLKVVCWIRIDISPETSMSAKNDKVVVRLSESFDDLAHIIRLASCVGRRDGQNGQQDGGEERRQGLHFDNWGFVTWNAYGYRWSSVSRALHRSEVGLFIPCSSILHTSSSLSIEGRSTEMFPFLLEPCLLGHSMKLHVLTR